MSLLVLRHGSCILRANLSKLYTIQFTRNYSSKSASTAREYSSKIGTAADASPETQPAWLQNNGAADLPDPFQDRPLKRLPTATLLRNIILGKLFTVPLLMNMGVAAINVMAETKNPIFDPDRNPILRRIMRFAIYDHFCSGITQQETIGGIAKIKTMGLTGVILNHAKEVTVDKDPTRGKGEVDAAVASKEDEDNVADWLDRNLKTIEMLGKDDFVGLKFTGAGMIAARALMANRPPPQSIQDAADAMCYAAKAKGARILVDAEQQIFQDAIDAWSIDLMRRHNRDGQVVVLNTVQAYLKNSRPNILYHLKTAQNQDWKLGIKLVRGAYIETDDRSKIHDTKADTDASYNGIVRDLLQRSFDGIEGKDFPDLQLFVAGHNIETIRKVAALHRRLVLEGRNPGKLEFGQLQGMADEVTMELVLQGEAATRNTKGLAPEQVRLQEQLAPRVFKCTNWGSVKECMGFLGRRAVENAGAAMRLKHGLEVSIYELKCRILRR